jgi:YidC/Oxa1 family membrane protein insertase
LDNARQIIIFVVLILAAIFYTDIVRWIRPPKPGTPTQTALPSSAAAPSPEAGATAGTGQVAQSSGQVAQPSGSPESIESAPPPAIGIAGIKSLTPVAVTPWPPRTIEVATDLYQAAITAKGARLLSFRLKQYRETVRKDSPLYDIVVQGERLPMGLIVKRGDTLYSAQGVDYATDAPARPRKVSSGSSASRSAMAPTCMR